MPKIRGFAETCDRFLLNFFSDAAVACVAAFVVAAAGLLSLVPGLTEGVGKSFVAVGNLFRWLVGP